MITEQISRRNLALGIGFVLGRVNTKKFLPGRNIYRVWMFFKGLDLDPGFFFLTAGFESGSTLLNGNRSLTLIVWGDTPCNAKFSEICPSNIVIIKQISLFDTALVMTNTLSVKSK